ncbi:MULTISPECIES: primosomal protein N' [unclassified Sulfurospirillum]|uniref:primosomal protein N' n=1 Tax=unclassified Sulfurospirillum TaxID=2618290 RepID=UPI000500B91E|nr:MULTISPECIES: primosomal protein N' [unclassified Sulfurospirillum]KFL33968.1 primosome assembly protein PriA [Sulfurospirillum sp. SCADC]
MFYYHIALLKSPLSPLTYQSEENFPLGAVVEVTLSKRTIQGVVVASVKKPSFECASILFTCKTFYPHKTLELARFIAEYYVCSLGEALNLFVPHSPNALHVNEKNTTDITLSTEQEKAYDFIQVHPTSLLFGDTGSGKTEIYMKLFEQTINEGKQAIFLLPEIGLTPQMKNRLKHHFGKHVAIWHSKITAKKKEQILSDIHEGKISIIAGTRSALFLPLQHLGLIVVDEEHDESYKSGNRPRYNAKDLALLFGQKLGCKVLLGSATPTLTSFYKVPTFRLKGTFFESQSYIMYDDGEHGLSFKMTQAIQKALNAHKQVIVFLPTRANFKYITCKQCGANVECPFCSVGMSIHHNMNALKCHYCNYTEVIPKACPKCGCEEIVATRMGTAEVSQKLTEHFHEHVVQQFDRDEVRTEKKLSEILSDFNEHKIDIMVGTQMLSKGHDYHGVGLAVILGVDALLGMSDFRSREKTLALVLQIAGRAGRKGYGEVLIQSKNSEFFKQYLGDFEQFLKDELVFRKGLYPPFKKMLRLMSAHVKDEKAKELIDKVALIAQRFPQVEVVGFGKANIAKIANKYRYELLARSDSSKALLELAHAVKLLHVEADIDPLSFS